MLKQAQMFSHLLVKLGENDVHADHVGIRAIWAEGIY